jgi:dihydroorotate dehydrogenase electron transfer subunit
LNGRVQIKAEVRSNEVLYGHGEQSPAWLLWMDAPSVAELAKPGQFVMVRCGESQDPLLRRPLGIHRVDSAGRVALLYQVAGRGTAWLSQRKPGDPIDLIGPLGNGFLVKPESRSLLLLAGGIGFTPLAFMADMAIKEGRTATVVMGSRSDKYLYPESQLPEGIKIVIATEDGSCGEKGLVTCLIDKFIGQADQVFACGPAAMYKSMAEMERLKGESVQVSLEERMACGVGACYGCTVKTRNGLKQVCHDGPVFDLAEMVW